MKKSIILLSLMSIGLCSCGQNGKLTQQSDAIQQETADSAISLEYIVLNFDSISYTESEFKQAESFPFVNTKFEYSFSTGNEVIIHNSYPKGGGKYYDPSGIQYGYGIFWTRVINETSTPLNLSLNFPAESFAISKAPNAYFKLFLLPDAVISEKLSSFDYGIKDLRTFLDSKFNKPTVLNKKVEPNEEFPFFIAMLIKVPQQNGAIRTALIAKDHKLYYRISIEPLGSTLIPCGDLSF